MSLFIQGSFPVAASHAYWFCIRSLKRFFVSFVISSKGLGCKIFRGAPRGKFTDVTDVIALVITSKASTWTSFSELFETSRQARSGILFPNSAGRGYHRDLRVFSYEPTQPIADSIAVAS